MIRMQAIVGCLLMTLSVRSGRANDDVYQAFPQTTIAFAKIASPEKTLKELLDHPLRDKIEKISQVKVALRSDEFLQFKNGLRIVETQLGTDWDKALKKLARNIYIGVDAASEGVAIVAVAEDEAFLKASVQRLLKLAKLTGNEDAYQEKKYRKLTAYKIDKAILVQVGTKLLFSNKGELAKSIVDSWLDGSKESLATKKSFQDAKSTFHDSLNAWAYVDLDHIRKAGIAKELFREQLNDIAAEFLFGGMSEAIRGASHAIFKTELSGSRLDLVASVPFDKEQHTKPRDYYFATSSEESPVVLQPKNALLNLVTYRDIGQLWLSKEDLLPENQIAELVKADSELTTVFSGLDFGEEVLGAAKPGIQLLVAKQTYDKQPLTPDVKLPAFALAFRLKDAAKLQRRFKIGFQSFVGFINIEQAQNGQPQFDLETENVGSAKIVSANYFDDGSPKKGLINYNFSPSLAFVDDWFFISSTTQFAKQLIGETQGGNLKRQSANNNTQARLSTDELRSVLQDNRAQLVAQNMLENGHSKSNAEQEISTLLSVLDLLTNASMKLDTANQAMTLSAAVELSE